MCNGTQEIQNEAAGSASSAHSPVTGAHPGAETSLGIAGLSVAGALLTGAGGILGAFVATLSGNWIAGAIFLAAAATAFGLLANAIYRH